MVVVIGAMAVPMHLLHGETPDDRRATRHDPAVAFGSAWRLASWLASAAIWLPHAGGDAALAGDGVLNQVTR